MLIHIVLFLFSATSYACINVPTIIVAQDGSGNFTTIQAALNSVSANQEKVHIFIKSGVYKEKIFITQSNILLEGEQLSSTIIQCSIARDIWRCNNADDWGAATININANDVELRNLSVFNNYGFENLTDSINCINSASVPQKKIIRKDGHQMALRVMQGATKLKAINCRFVAYGGDTVSPWNVEDGMWYFKDCIIEGGVDFYCPRGWAWAENCVFIAHSGSAAIWHDGSANKNAASVFVNCQFKGFDGFNLGRYHRDAQFFFKNCEFDFNMSAQPIYLVPTTNKIQWGHRVYFYNSKCKTPIAWLKNNFPQHISPANLQTQWLFGDRWNPQN